MLDEVQVIMDSERQTSLYILRGTILSIFPLHDGRVSHFRSVPGDT